MKGFRISVAIGAAVVVAACATTPAPETTQPAATPSRRISEDSLAKLEALYKARLDSSRMRFTPADVNFVTSMIAHHAQAIEMSNLVPDRTTSESMKILAGRIINAQNDEISWMQRWLRDRRQPVPEVHVMEGRVMVHGAGDHTMHAPGMLTPQQMGQLRDARGTEFDRLFLTFMIQHHRGATAMVKQLFATDGAAQDEEVFKLAADVEADQTSEIERMQLMLKALAGGGGL